MPCGNKIPCISISQANTRLSRSCKHHCSTHYDTCIVRAQQDGRASVLTPTRLRRVGVSVYTYIKCVFARTAVLSIVLESTQNFEAFLFIQKNCIYNQKNTKKCGEDFVKNRMKQHKAEHWNPICPKITYTFKFICQLV